jgi:hypothetical protein
MILRLRVWAALLWTVVILILCWTPRTYLPVVEDQGSYFEFVHLDKVVHAGIFIVFSVLCLRAMPSRPLSYLIVLLAGLLLAVVTEVVQNVPIINREGEIGDVVTDVAGVLLGFPLYRFIEGRYDRWRLSKSRHDVVAPTVASDDTA